MPAPYNSVDVAKNGNTTSKHLGWPPRSQQYERYVTKGKAKWWETPGDAQSKVHAGNGNSMSGGSLARRLQPPRPRRAASEPHSVVLTNRVVRTSLRITAGGEEGDPGIPWALADDDYIDDHNTRYKEPDREPPRGGKGKKKGYADAPRATPYRPQSQGKARAGKGSQGNARGDRGERDWGKRAAARERQEFAQRYSESDLQRPIDDVLRPPDDIAQLLRERAPARELMRQKAEHLRQQFPPNVGLALLASIMVKEWRDDTVIQALLHNVLFEVDPAVLQQARQTPLGRATEVTMRHLKKAYFGDSMLDRWQQKDGLHRGAMAFVAEHPGPTYDQKTAVGGDRRAPRPIIPIITVCNVFPGPCPGGGISMSVCEIAFVCMSGINHVFDFSELHVHHCGNDGTDWPNVNGVWVLERNGRLWFLSRAAIQKLIHALNGNTAVSPKQRMKIVCDLLKECECSKPQKVYDWLIAPRKGAQEVAITRIVDGKAFTRRDELLTLLRRRCPRWKDGEVPPPTDGSGQGPSGGAKGPGQRPGGKNKNPWGKVQGKKPPPGAAPEKRPPATLIVDQFANAQVMQLSMLQPGGQGVALAHSMEEARAAWRLLRPGGGAQAILASKQIPEAPEAEPRMVLVKRGDRTENLPVQVHQIGAFAVDLTRKIIPKFAPRDNLVEIVGELDEQFAPERIFETARKSPEDGRRIARSWLRKAAEAKLTPDGTPIATKAKWIERGLTEAEWENAEAAPDPIADVFSARLVGSVKGMRVVSVVARVKKERVVDLLRAAGGDGDRTHYGFFTRKLWRNDAEKSEFSVVWLRGRTIAEARDAAARIPESIGVARNGRGLGIRVPAAQHAAVQRAVLGADEVRRRSRKIWEVSNAPREMDGEGLCEVLREWGWTVETIRSFVPRQPRAGRTWIVAAHDPVPGGEQTSLLQVGEHVVVVQAAMDRPPPWAKGPQQARNGPGYHPGGPGQSPGGNYQRHFPPPPGPGSGPGFNPGGAWAPQRPRPPTACALSGPYGPHVHNPYETLAISVMEIGEVFAEIDSRAPPPSGAATYFRECEDDARHWLDQLRKRAPTPQEASSPPRRADPSGGDGAAPAAPAPPLPPPPQQQDIGATLAAMQASLEGLQRQLTESNRQLEAMRRENEELRKRLERSEGRAERRRDGRDSPEVGSAGSRAACTGAANCQCRQCERKQQTADTGTGPPS
eukprot:gene46479-43746_t